MCEAHALRTCQNAYPQIILSSCVQRNSVSSCTTCVSSVTMAQVRPRDLPQRSIRLGFAKSCDPIKRIITNTLQTRHNNAPDKNCIYDVSVTQKKEVSLDFGAHFTDWFELQPRVAHNTCHLINNKKKYEILKCIFI